MSQPLRERIATVQAWARQSRQRHAVRQLTHPLSPFGRRLRAVRRALLLSLAVFVLVPTIAYAADDQAAVNGFISMFSLQDTHGHTISSYELNIDRSGPTDPPKMVAALLLTWGWDIYRFWVGLGMWLMDQGIRFEFINWLRDPMRAMAEAINGVIRDLGIAPTLMTLTAFSIFGLLHRGRYGTGFLKVAVAAVAGALLFSPVGNPLPWLVEDGGAIDTMRDIGAQTSYRLVVGAPEVSADKGDNQIEREYARIEHNAAKVSADQGLSEAGTAKMIDNLVRRPHQLINYGAKIDGTACESTYDADLAKGPWGNKPEPRQHLGKCDKKLEVIADNPPVQMLSMMIITPGGFLIGALGFVFGLLMFAAAGWAMWEGISFGVHLLAASGPSDAGRISVFTAAMGILSALVAIVLLIVATSMMVMCLSAVFKGTENWRPEIIFVVVDVFLVAAIIWLIVMVRRTRAHGRRLGRELGSKLASKPTAMPKSTGLMMRGAAISAAGLGARALQNRNLLNRAGGATLGSSGAATAVAGAIGGPAAAAAVGGATKAMTLASVANGAGKVAKYGLQGTLGAPVYHRRWYGTSKTAMTNHLANARTQLHDVKTQAGLKVDAARQRAGAFGAEYVEGLDVMARRTGLAAVGRGVKAFAEPGIQHAAEQSAPLVTSAALLAGRVSGAGRAPQTSLARNVGAPAPGKMRPAVSPGDFPEAFARRAPVVEELPAPPPRSYAPRPGRRSPEDRLRALLAASAKSGQRGEN